VLTNFICALFFSFAECDTAKKKGRWYLRRWEKYVKYELDPPARNRTLCSYLAEEPVDVGMHAYIGTYAIRLDTAVGSSWDAYEYKAADCIIYFICLNSIPPPTLRRLFFHICPVIIHCRLGISLSL